MNLKFLNSFLCTNKYLITYFILFLILWDTKGMSTSVAVPVAVPLLTLVLIGVAILPNSKKIDFEKLNFLWIILLQFIFFIIANFESAHDVFNYTELVEFKFSFLLVFYCSFFTFLFYCITNNLKILYLLIIELCLLMIHSVFSSKNPGIDTHLFLTMASDYFLNFQDPYSFNYPDIYNGKYSEVYGDKFYFNYWPTALYLCSIFKLIFGEIRYVFITFQLFMCWKLYRWNSNIKNEEKLLFIVLWLSNMIVIFVNERSWIDALVPYLLTVCIYFIIKNKLIQASVLIGLIASVKLYYIFIVPFYFIYLLKIKKVKFVFISGFTFILPFMLFLIFSFDNIFNSTISFINSTKIRSDSLSIISCVNKYLSIDLSKLGTIIMFVSLIVLLVYQYFKLLTVIDFLKVLNIMFLIIFLTAKQAFCNYYYFNMYLCFIIYFLQINTQKHVE